jgi:hypothetical protein
LLPFFLFRKRALDLPAGMFNLCDIPPFLSVNITFPAFLPIQRTDIKKTIIYVFPYTLLQKPSVTHELAWAQHKVDGKFRHPHRSVGKIRHPHRSVGKTRHQDMYCGSGRSIYMWLTEFSVTLVFCSCVTHVFFNSDIDYPFNWLRLLIFGLECGREGRIYRRWRKRLLLSGDPEARSLDQ